MLPFIVPLVANILAKSQKTRQAHREEEQVLAGASASANGAPMYGLHALKSNRDIGKEQDDDYLKNILPYLSGGG